MFANSLNHLLAADATTAADKAIEQVDWVVQALQPVVQMIAPLLGMLLLLAIGFVVARFVARAIEALGNRIGLQTAAERSGLTESMKKVGIEKGVPAIVGQIFFWLLMSVFLLAGVNILGLPGVSETMQKLVEYIPNLLAAMAIVVIGLLIANFFRGVIATAADRVGISYADRLATGCYYVLALMTFIWAFEQLEVGFALLNQMILIAFGALAVGLGLALGLGGRDVVGGILAGYYVRQRMHSGDAVSVAGLEGTVREVGPVATVIETQAEGLTERHTVPNTKMLNEAVR